MDTLTHLSSVQAAALREELRCARLALGSHSRRLARQACQLRTGMAAAGMQPC